MSRSPLGWDYPPGAERDPAAPWNQVDHDADDQRCPCRQCREDRYDAAMEDRADRERDEGRDEE